MKNAVYAGIIVACIIVAVIVFVKTRGGGSGLDDLPDSEMTWVKCLKCGKSYEMPLKEFLKESREKTAASPGGMPIALPLTCKECGKDGIVRAYKCGNCGEVFRAGSVPADLEDRCPKCKHSAMEDKREANRIKMQQGG